MCNLYILSDKKELGDCNQAAQAVLPLVCLRDGTRTVRPRTCLIVAWAVRSPLSSTSSMCCHSLETIPCSSPAGVISVSSCSVVVKHESRSEAAMRQVGRICKLTVPKRCHLGCKRCQDHVHSNVATATATADKQARTRSPALLGHSPFFQTAAVPCESRDVEGRDCVKERCTISIRATARAGPSFALFVDVDHAGSTPFVDGSTKDALQATGRVERRHTQHLTRVMLAAGVPGC